MLNYLNLRLLAVTAILTKLCFEASGGVRYTAQDPDEQAQHRDQDLLVSLNALGATLQKEEKRWMDAYGADIIDASQLQEKLSDIKKRREVPHSEIAPVTERMESREHTKSQRAAVLAMVEDLQATASLVSEIEDGFQCFTAVDKRWVLEVLETRVYMHGSDQEPEVRCILTPSLLEALKRPVAVSGQTMDCDSSIRIPQQSGPPFCC